MNRTIFIIAVVIVAILGVSYLIIEFNPQLQSNPWIKPIAEVFSLVEDAVVPENYNAVFCIFDPSGSGKYTYSVPKISVEFVEDMIAAIADQGHGEIWLTYIARSAFSTKVLHFTVPKRIKALEPPVRKAGQLKGEYDRVLAEFLADSNISASKMTAELKNYNIAKEKFLKECSEMINNSYAPKKRGEDYSDIIGSLNAALRGLGTIVSDSTHFRSILLISDGVQDIPAGDFKQKLNEIPADVMLVTVNHSGSPKSIVAGKSIEVDNLNRGLEKVIRVYKPKNQ
ncbi:MAG: hypothetical protein M0Q41_02125 [Bacteroidales bacterium]|nr:hypothetical protein [Acholeplasmataceae bacterium]MCK9447754.1 hypothetical protein [Bacteroidales bacterium]